MSQVWDPVIEIKFKHSGVAQAAGEEWISSAYELPPDEVLEIFNVSVIPPVDANTGRIKKLRYVTLRIGNMEYDSLRINSVMMPAEHPLNAGVAPDLGVPYLWRPLTGRIPTPIEATCPKVRRSEKLAVRVVADESISSTESYTVVVRAARVRGESKLVEVVGASSISVSFMLNEDVYAKPPITVSLSTFDELPGGLRQVKPQILPWVTYARNKVPTTPNTWYDFVYDSYAAYDWMTLSWNLVNKEEAFLVDALGIIPHSNSKAARIYVEGRVTNPEYMTRPLPEENYFTPIQFYDTSVNANLKRVGPRIINPSFLFHGVKGGIQIIDNGTSIPEDSVEVHVYGRKFVLR